MAAGRPPQWPGKEETVQLPPTLTPEETAVLVECRHNAVFYRGLPIGIISAVAVRHMVRRICPPHFLRMLSPLATAGAFLFGCGSGIASYQQPCIQKLLALPNSPLADVIRKQQASKGKTSGNVDLNPDQGPQNQWSNEHTAKHFEDERKTPLPGSKGYESDSTVRNQNAFVWDTASAPEKEPEKKGISYEELRQKHRASQQQQYQPYRRRKPPPPPQPPTTQEEQGSDIIPDKWKEEEPKPNNRQRRNQYGDLID